MGEIARFRNTGDWHNGFITIESDGDLTARSYILLKNPGSWDGIISLEAGTAGIAFRNNANINSPPDMILSGDKLGIGNPTPSAKLDVAGTARLSGHASIGGGSSINPSSNFTVLDVNETATSIPTTVSLGTRSTLVLDPQSALPANALAYGSRSDLSTASGNAQSFASAALIGSRSNVTHNAASDVSFVAASQSVGATNGTGAVGTLYGSQANVTHNGSGALTYFRGVNSVATNASSGQVFEMIGVGGYVQNTSTGLVDRAVGFGARTFNTSTGTLDYAYGMRIYSTTNSGGGTVNRNYGLKIDDQSAVGSMESFNLYSDGASSKNYFAGSVGIGTGTPISQLHAYASWGSALVLDQPGTGTGTKSEIYLHTKGTGGAWLGTAGTKGWQITARSDAFNSPSTEQNDLGFYHYDGSSWISTLWLDSSGKVGVGTNDPSEKLHVVGNLRVQGTTDCTLGGGSGATNCSSDERLKDHIVPIGGALEKISRLRGVEFDWNEKSLSPGRHSIGVIAQDVQRVFPTAVITNASGYLAVDYAVLVAPLIEATKELKAENDALKASNDELKARLDRLEALLGR